jgi:hypothetical protein
MADRTYTPYPVFANGEGESPLQFDTYKIIHTASETWKQGTVLERHATLADTLIEWAGSNRPIAILAVNSLDVSTTAAVSTVVMNYTRAILNSKYIRVGGDTRPTQAQIKLLEDAGFTVVSGVHA